MYLYSPSLSQISLKNSFGKVFFFFKIWPKSKWREIKIGYLAAILKGNNILFFFSELWFFIARIFKSRLLKMAATVMTAEFGTIHYYSSLEEYSEACLCSSLDRH